MDAGSAHEFHGGGHEDESVEEHVDVHFLHQHAHKHRQKAFSQHASCHDIAQLVLGQAESELGADCQDQDVEGGHWSAEDGCAEVAHQVGMSRVDQQEAEDSWAHDAVEQRSHFVAGGAGHEGRGKPEKRHEYPENRGVYRRALLCVYSCQNRVRRNPPSVGQLGPNVREQSNAQQNFDVSGRGSLRWGLISVLEFGVLVLGRGEKVVGGEGE